MASGTTKSTPKKYESRHLLLSDALSEKVGLILFEQRRWESSDCPVGDAIVRWARF